MFTNGKASDLAKAITLTILLMQTESARGNYILGNDSTHETLLEWLEDLTWRGGMYAALYDYVDNCKQFDVYFETVWMLHDQLQLNPTKRSISLLA
jgi:hypothetical protein